MPPGGSRESPPQRSRTSYADTCRGLVGDSSWTCRGQGSCALVPLGTEINENKPAVLRHRYKAARMAEVHEAYGLAVLEVVRVELLELKSQTALVPGDA